MTSTGALTPELRRIAERAASALQSFPDRSAAQHLRDRLDHAVAALEVGDSDGAAMALLHLKTDVDRYKALAKTAASNDLCPALGLLGAFVVLAPPAAEVRTVDGVEVYLVNSATRALSTPGVTPLHAALAIEQERTAAMRPVLREVLNQDDARSAEWENTSATGRNAHRDNAQERQRHADWWFSKAWKAGSGRAALMSAARALVDEQLANVRHIISTTDDPRARANLDRRRLSLEGDRRLLTETRAKTFLKARNG